MSEMVAGSQCTEGTAAVNAKQKKRDLFKKNKKQKKGKELKNARRLRKN